MAALVITLLIVLPGGIAVGSTALLYWHAVQGLAEPQESVLLDPIVGPTQLFDSTGRTLIFSVQDPLGNERTWKTLDELPPHVIDATLIWEDPDFLTTTRFDLLSAVGGLWSGVMSGSTAPDPSITGRLVRNTILSYPGSDASREAALVAEINRRFTPERILEWHLNTNYYGNDAYGIEAAAQMYLGKTASNLSLDEAALLAAVPLAPQYNPFQNEAAARGRQQDVLRALYRAGAITQDEFDRAIGSTTEIEPGNRFLPQMAPDFAQYARDQAERILDATGRDGAQMIARGGLRITTTLDLDLYYETDCALRQHLAQLAGTPVDVTGLNGTPCRGTAYLPPVSAVEMPPNRGAISIIDVSSGKILAMVGPAAETRYQPGPILQPFVYFSAFASALYNPATMVLDIPKQYPGSQEGLIYTPSNPDGRYRGPMNLREAMGAGLFAPVADIAYRQGIDNVLRKAHQIGLNSLNLGTYDLMLLERDGEVSVLDVTYAYSVFASLGRMHGVSVDPIGNGYRGRDPVAVLRIEDGAGNVLWEYREEDIPVNTTNVLDPGLGYLVTDVLSDQETRWPVLGENNVLDLSRPSAVVNGLTFDRADNWTVGYTPQLVVGVHLGRLEDGARQPITVDPNGLQGAAPLWRALMEYAHARDALAPETWPRPSTIVQVPVCERSGTLPTGACPVRTEIFLDGTQTRLHADTFWQSFEINSQTGQLATPNTPTEYRTERVYFVPPPEAFEWWEENRLPLPPTEYDSVARPELFGSTAILQPEPFAYVGGVVDIRGSLDVDQMQYYQLAYGKGINPDAWLDIGGPQTTFQRGESLGRWDTAGLDGLYNLRLTVVMEDNAIETQVVQVTVDNVAPTLSLTAGISGQIYRWPGDTLIPLQAHVEDNLAVDRVEFYHNGSFLGADQEWPYGFDWQISGTGTETFTATAFDAVGNSASSEIPVEVVRDG